MRLRQSDLKVRTDGQFQQGRHRRTDRGEQQGHRSESILGEMAKGAPARTVPRVIGRTAATSWRSIPRTGLAGNGPNGPFVLTRWSAGSLGGG